MVEIIVLGNSAATPAYNRHPTAQLIKFPHSNFLVDCGEGTQMQMLRYRIKSNKINHIFISHLHGDHYLGLMGLISTFHLNQRDKELNIYAPRGLADIIRIQLKCSNSRLSYKINFFEINPLQSEIIYEDAHLTVETILLNHQINCTGFLFKEKKQSKRKIIKEKITEEMSWQHLAMLKNGEDVKDEADNLLYSIEDYTYLPRNASYAFCSDTAYTESIIDQIAGVDLLYHESTFLDADLDKAIQTFHSTAKQAAQIALKASVSRLMLGHFSARYKDLSLFYEESKSIFENTILSEEGVRVFISDY